MSVFEGFSHFGSTEGEGVAYIVRISLKNIPATGEDFRSLSYTISDTYIFPREVMGAI
jgi:hypothetical protein